MKNGNGIPPSEVPNSCLLNCSFLTETPFWELAFDAVVRGGSDGRLR
jgi:hypothetical protein